MPTANPNAGTGILSVWNDYAPEREDDYERWYMREHFPERLSVPGFLRGRRYQAIEADRKYFTFYDLDSARVLFSPAYIAQLDNPTPWTQRVMTGWQAMFRTVCERIARSGEAVGAFCAVARWEAPATLAPEFAQSVIETLDDPAVVAVDLWRAALEQNTPSKEAGTRSGPDRTISGALLIETTRVASAERAAAQLSRLLADRTSAPAAIGIYGLIALQDAPHASKD